MIQKEAVFVVLGLFSRSRKDEDMADLLPPPPPFPDLDMEQESLQAQILDLPKQRTKIIIKPSKASVDDILGQAEGLEPLQEQSLSSDHWDTDHWDVDLAEHDAALSEPLDAKEIDSAISGIKEVTPKKGFFARLFSPKLSPSKGKEPTPEPFDEQMMETDSSPQEQMREVESVREKISNAQRFLSNRELAKARDAYIDIMKDYRMMTEDEQQEVYGEIRKLYDDRKAAEMR